MWFSRTKKKPPLKDSDDNGPGTKLPDELDLSVHNYIEIKDKDDPGPQFPTPPVVLPCQGYRIELGSQLKTVDNVALERTEKNSLYYREHFHEKPHANFIGGDANNPLIVSISLTPVNGKCKTIVRTKKDDYYRSITASHSKKRLLKTLTKELPTLLNGVKLKHIPDDSLCTKLLHMEDRMLVKAYKFGVIYAKEGQTHEDEMFGNETWSPYFDEFLALLGEKVELKGYTRYRGGLDVENNTTGTHAIVTRFKDYDIIYHVAPLLPQTQDKQQVERKRHIGNDVVSIVFQDGPTVLNPSAVVTKFTHVFVVVQRLVKNNPAEPTRYRLGISSKQGVEPHGPPLPADPVFEAGPAFREFLLTKVVNAERAAYYAPGFGQSRTRRLWMKEILEQYGVIAPS